MSQSDTPTAPATTGSELDDFVEHLINPPRSKEITPVYVEEWLRDNLIAFRAGPRSATPAATTAGTPGNLADEIGYQTALNMLDEIDGYPTACVLVRRYIDELRGRLATLQHQHAETPGVDAIVATLEGRPTVADANKPLALRITHAISMLRRFAAQHAEQDARIAAPTTAEIAVAIGEWQEEVERLRARVAELQTRIKQLATL